MWTSVSFCEPLLAVHIIKLFSLMGNEMVDGINNSLTWSWKETATEGEGMEMLVLSLVPLEISFSSLDFSPATANIVFAASRLSRSLFRTSSLRPTIPIIKTRI